jgi:hypothetical protein
LPQRIANRKTIARQGIIRGTPMNGDEEPPGGNPGGGGAGDDDAVADAVKEAIEKKFPDEGDWETIVREIFRNPSMPDFWEDVGDGASDDEPGLE